MKTDPISEAYTLHLAGVSITSIAERMSVDVDEARRVLAVESAARQPGRDPAVADHLERLTSLWRKVYTEGLKGDTASIKVAVELTDRILELQARAEPVELAESPGAAIQGAWSDLADGAVEAAATVRAMAVNGRSESQRLRAALGVLDRVGLSNRVDVPASVKMATAAMDPDDPSIQAKTGAQIVRERLVVLRERHVMMAAAEETAVAELVGDVDTDG